MGLTEELFDTNRFIHEKHVWLTDPPLDTTSHHPSSVPGLRCVCLCEEQVEGEEEEGEEEEERRRSSQLNGACDVLFLINLDL